MTNMKEWQDALDEAADTLAREAETDGVLAWMIKTEQRLTRECYLRNAFWGESVNLDAEGEAQLPEMFRREPVDDGMDKEK
jgi:hypothetical protein